ncbi:hypothetical protein OPV22_026073 [Ensete ventricosum]|uniref:Uncharacterized protein n=1 Tax=Ensete ventricosum TaxID=4639 RepID=A0AAV8QBL6_ENSVE|nr:hypothetical protein OPV22_026073 [Ensete ventricosum]
MNPSSWANAKTDDSYLMADGLAICVTKTFGWYMEMDRFQKCAVESLKKLPVRRVHHGRLRLPPLNSLLVPSNTSRRVSWSVTAALSHVLRSSILEAFSSSSPDADCISAVEQLLAVPELCLPLPGDSNDPAKVETFSTASMATVRERA